MKRIILLAIVFLTTVASMNAQAKKPTIMVVPSDVWCNQRGYMLDFDNQGTYVQVPDYKRAVQEDAALLIVISKINELMASRGFPLKNLESVLKSLESESAEDAMLSGKKTGASVVESPIDKLKKVAKADIIMQVTWNVNTVGPKHSITFNIQGLDSYTDKQVAGASGTGQELIGSTLPVMLETAVLSQIDNFNVQLMSHFDDLFANGREITLRVKKFDSFADDFEADYGGEELGTQIENWVQKNTVKGRFSTTDATENMLFFEQVRIPLFDATGKAIDARAWAKGLQKYLKDTFKIEAKLMTKGLGQASIVVGEK
ncbi:DUF6175 family protein [Flavobacterium muglaense]|uniref:Curli production assembly/transport component CsgG n=1 Tax=Flavobacterium muglaense TaxID=2764716 RepID=A0A923SF86_9FLAO|nr:DUF6175 family protein [Flavobacterium muglaense]MBC5837862.1 hypothetical protein [Flavobacterium muglaense]MBC5844331.1 hypothetical protein [Flavobacterium muglaense]